jgi:DNA modification methylase
MDQTAQAPRAKAVTSLPKPDGACTTALDQLCFDLDLTLGIGLNDPDSPEEFVGTLSLEDLVAKHLPKVRLDPLPQTLIPKLAKDHGATRALERAIKQIPTEHRFLCRDARDLSLIPDETIHLVLTSPPYWTLKKYPSSEGQLGDLGDYDVFIKELDRVWAECHRALVPGGRLIIVVGDVCLSRRKHGEHRVVPLHASIQEHCVAVGFHNLAPIIWYKIANAVFEVDNGTSFLGKPYEPNGIVKNDIEFILMQRKPGGYRRPTAAMRVLSLIGEKNHKIWFNQILDLRGASTKNHPAPFPLELAERLIRMFSFVSDSVLDPFGGTGTTSLAASRWGRNSISVEIDPGYHAASVQRARAAIKKEGLVANILKR